MSRHAANAGQTKVNCQYSERTEVKSAVTRRLKDEQSVAVPGLTKIKRKTGN